MARNKAASTNSYLLLWRGLWNLEQSGGNWLSFSHALAFYLWFSRRGFRWTVGRGGEGNLPFLTFSRAGAACARILPGRREVGRSFCVGAGLWFPSTKCSGTNGQVLCGSVAFGLMLIVWGKVVSNCRDSRECSARVLLTLSRPRTSSDSRTSTERNRGDYEAVEATAGFSRGAVRRFSIPVKTACVTLQGRTLC